MNSAADAFANAIQEFQTVGGSGTGGSSGIGGGVTYTNPEDIVELPIETCTGALELVHFTSVTTSLVISGQSAVINFTFTPTYRIEAGEAISINAGFIFSETFDVCAVLADSQQECPIEPDNQAEISLTFEVPDGHPSLSFSCTYPLS